MTPLDLHWHRRQDKIPTLSVLVGSAASTSAAWKHWSEQQGRVALVSTALPPYRCWCQQWLDRRCGLTSLFSKLQHQTEYDFVSACARHPSESSLDTAGLRRLYRMLTGASPTEARTATTGRSAAVADTGDIALLRMLAALAEPHALPALAVRGSVHAELMSELLDGLYHLVSTHPTLPVALLLHVADYAQLQRSQSPSRAMALLREGLIKLSKHDDGSANASDSTPDRGQMTAFGPSPSARAALERLHPTPAMRQNLLRLANAVAAQRNAKQDQPCREPADRARSLAERLLFDCLQRQPETVDRFRLNAKLPIVFGNRPLEVDLLAPSIRLAVEVDGYYHFQNADAYRRDRRKDLLLQQHGYLVMRVLAEDVVERLDALLAAIGTAVARALAPNGHGDTAPVTLGDV